MRIIRRPEFKTSAWKNGAGLTHEAIRVPADAERYLWRVSVAEIAASGPFSDFTGYRRHMVLLQGDGLRLRFSNGREAQLRRPGDLAEFDGALQTQCDLAGGACTDLNLLTARSIAMTDARVEQLSAPLRLRCGAGESLVLVCVRGTISIERAGHEPAALGRWDLGVRERSVATEEMRCVPGRPGDDLLFVAKFTET